MTIIVVILTRPGPTSRLAAQGKERALVSDSQTLLQNIPNIQLSESSHVGPRMFVVRNVCCDCLILSLTKCMRGGQNLNILTIVEGDKDSYGAHSLSLLS